MLQGRGIAMSYDLLDRKGSVVEENRELMWLMEEEA